MVITLKLQGESFDVDEGAYNALKKGIERAIGFASDEMKEVLQANVEGRLAEYLRSVYNPTHILTEQEVVSAFVATGLTAEGSAETLKSIPPEMPKFDQLTDVRIDVKKEEREDKGEEKGEKGEKGEKVGRSEKHLYRISSDGVLGGVCAGLAEYLLIDVIIVRLLMALALFVSSGLMAVAYVVMWIVMPDEPYDGQASNVIGDAEIIDGRTGRRQGRGRRIGCLIVFLLGLLLIGTFLAFPLIFALIVKLLKFSMFY